MKKLTIEHLAAYLPYGVNLYVNDHSRNERNVRPNEWDLFKMVALSDCEVIIHVQGESFGDDWYSYDRVKPVLRPISDLTREITHNGETFVPIERLGKKFSSMKSDLYPNTVSLDVSDSVSINLLHYMGSITKLHSWHFDTFGLGADNLCVYMNPDGTLSK